MTIETRSQYNIMGSYAKYFISISCTCAKQQTYFRTFYYSVHYLSGFLFHVALILPVYG